ncbi:MAG TPA: acyltransferase [Opitutaceae bacterium]
MTPPRGLPSRPPGGRLEVLDELKGVAIVLILLYHAGGVMGWRNLLQGQVGVDMFVFLSGVGLALSTRDAGTLGFLFQRFWRIYPAYWIVLTGFLLADAHFLGWHFSGVDTALHYLGIQALFGPEHEMSVNDSFWFVTLIVCLYLLYAPMRRLMGRPGWILLIGIAVSLAPAVAALFSMRAAGFEHIAERVPGFFVGLVVGRRIRTGELGLSPSKALLGSIVLLVGVPYACGATIDLALLSLAITAAYAFLAAPALPGAARASLRFLGNRSLEIFLIHQPLIREYNVLVQARLFPGAPETPWALALGIALGLTVTIALSVGLHSLLAKVPVPGSSQAHS